VRSWTTSCPITPLGFYADEPHLAWFEVGVTAPDVETDALVGGAVGFADGVLARDGTGLPQATVAIDFAAADVLDRHRGLRDCHPWA